MPTNRNLVPKLFLLFFLIHTVVPTAAQWISPPDIDGKEFGVYYFAKEVGLDKLPGQLPIDISADNRYILYVNGKELSRGPARGDLNHWSYETVDIAPFLRKGTNRLLICVWNFGEQRPSGQISTQTALWIASGNSLFSTASGWKVAHDTGYSPIPVRAGVEVRGGYLSGASERRDYRYSITDRENRPLSDPIWKEAKELVFDGPAPWKLQKRSIPSLEQRKGPIGKIRESKNAGRRFPMTIAPNTRAEIIIDHETLTIGHPEFRFSKGKESVIRFTYLEAPFLPGQRDEKGNLIGEGQEKGDRNEIEGKEFVGNYDEIIAGGSGGCSYSPLWYRCFRYIKVDIQTKYEPLVIHAFDHLFSAYPFEEKATFKSDDERIGQIWDISWRTVRMCAHETYNDCPYYEQLQYIGDTRIQALISLVVSGDDRLMRQAIRQFAASQNEEGMLQAAYPNSGNNIIPPFSLWWVGMVYDYYRYRPDKDFVREQLPHIISILDWYTRYIDPSKGLLGKMPGWHFVDWPDEWAWLKTQGLPAGAKEGESAILSLQFALIAGQAADLLQAFGKSDEAARYTRLAGLIKTGVRQSCFDTGRGLFADSPQKTEYSQHVNALAILCGMVEGEAANRLAECVMSDGSLIQCTVYYRFYLHRALAKAGRSDLFLTHLDPWEKMIKLNLTTFAERQEPTRSDCHAWSANPLFELLSGVCGIEPGAPGFGQVRVSPNPGYLKKIDASMPHPNGEIKFRYRKNDKNETVIISLPPNCSGKYVTNQKDVISLKPGKNKITINNIYLSK